MSQFIEKLKRISQAVSQPMGFRATQSTAGKPGILLMANLAQADVDSVTDRLAGADAGLLSIAKPNLSAKLLAKVSSAVSNIPWGGWLEGISEQETAQIAKIGFDFVVFPSATTSLAILKDAKVGKILEINPSLREDLLVTIDELPVDAVLAVGERGKDYFLTWQHLMFFQRCAGLLTKPLLVSIPPSVSSHELQALWEVGVNGVVVKIENEQPADILTELRQTIDRLPLTAPRKLRKAEPLLPYPSGKTYTVVEEEEE